MVARPVEASPLTGRPGICLKKPMICCDMGLMSLAGYSSAGGVDYAGDGVFYRHHQDAVEFILRRQSEHVERLQGLPKAFVVDKVEQLVLEYGPAEVNPELVTIEGRLLKGNDISRIAHDGWLEVAGGIQIGVADELIRRGVKVIGSAGGGNVHRRPGRAAVFRALVVGHHFPLRHGVGWNRDDLVVKALVALAIGVVIHAVE